MQLTYCYFHKIVMQCKTSCPLSGTPPYTNVLPSASSWRALAPVVIHSVTRPTSQNISPKPMERNMGLLQKQVVSHKQAHQASVTLHTVSTLYWTWRTFRVSKWPGPVFFAALPCAVGLNCFTLVTVCFNRDFSKPLMLPNTACLSLSDILDLCL